MSTALVPRWRNRAIGLAIAAAIFAADQWMKHFVVDVLGLTQPSDHKDLLPFFDFTRQNNFGVSLGMLQATSMEMRWILVLATAAIAALVLVWMLREKLLGDIGALALVLGGALGNIVDRVTLGFVVDYADLHFGEFRPFLIFNVADAAITIGVVLLLARTLFRREKRAPAQDGPRRRPNPRRKCLMFTSHLARHAPCWRFPPRSCSAAAPAAGCFRRERPDEFAVQRQAPLVVPPDFELVPPKPGAPRPTEGTAAQQALDALFGAPPSAARWRRAH